MGSSAAKFVSEEEKEETSSDVKSLDCWDLSSSEELRDQNGMVDNDEFVIGLRKKTDLDMHTYTKTSVGEGQDCCLDGFCWQFLVLWIFGYLWL